MYSSFSQVVSCYHQSPKFPITTPEQGHVPRITLFRNRPQLCIFLYHTCNLVQSLILRKINRKASIRLNGNANCTVLFKKPQKLWFSGPVVVTCQGPGQPLHRPWAECWLPGRCQWARCLPSHRPSAFCSAGTVPAATQDQRLLLLKFWSLDSAVKEPAASQAQCQSPILPVTSA